MATALASPPPVAEAPPFHLSGAWARCWAEAYGGQAADFDVDGATLRMELRNDKLGPLRFRLLTSATNLQTCYFDVEGEPSRDALAALPERLLATGADQVRIDWLTADSPLIAAAAGWAERHAVIVEPFALSPLADCREGVDAYLARTGGTLRKIWKASRRHLREGLDFAIVVGGPRLDAILAEMFALEAAGWKGREGTAILARPDDLAFYTRLAHEAAAAGALRLALVREEGRIIAYEYCLVAGREVLALKVGYDESRARLQPGHMAALLNIAAACADPGLDWYDMLGNGMRVAPYKQRYATDYRNLHRVRLFAPTMRGRLLHAAYRARPFAKAGIARLRALGSRFSRLAPRLQKAGSGSRHEKT